MNEVSANIWKMFQTASQAGKETNGLLDLIEAEIEKFGEKEACSTVKEIELLGSDDNFDDSGWVFLNETRSYGVVPKGKRKVHYVIGVQVILFDTEGSLLGEQSVLNICLQYEENGTKFDSENWFTIEKDNEWDGYEVQSNGYTICALTDDEFKEDGNEIIFSMPLGALASPSDVETKVIKPIQALLTHLAPNAEEVVQALAQAGDIINLSGIDFPKSDIQDSQ